MKKIFSLILTLMMSVSFAFAGSEKNLKSVFEEFQYAMTVEWDQIDEDFKAEAIEKFLSQIKELQAAGMTSKELMSFASSQLNDQSQFVRIENAFVTMKNNQISHDQFMQIIQEILNNAQMQGASWSQDSSIVVGLGIICAIFVLAAIFDVSIAYSGSF